MKLRPFQQEAVDAVYRYLREHDDNLLNAICYEIGVKELIAQGYLCPLVTKAGLKRVDTSGLDYGGNILRHGPVDTIRVPQQSGKGDAPAKECPECHSVIAAGYAASQGTGPNGDTYTEEEAVRSLESAYAQAPREPAVVRSEGSVCDGVDTSKIEEKARAGVQDEHPDCKAGKDKEPKAKRPYKAVPLPSDLLDVPGFIGEYAAFATETNYAEQPVLSLAGAVAFQGFLAGRKIRDASNTRTNVNVLSVVNTCCGKERIRTVCKDTLDPVG